MFTKNKVFLNTLLPLTKADTRQVHAFIKLFTHMHSFLPLILSGMYVSCAMCLFAGYIEEACIIPCPSDCKLSEWSNWSRCSKSCGSGVKVRSKWLREKPYNGGRPCPKLDHVNQVTPLALDSLMYQ